MPWTNQGGGGGPWGAPPGGNGPGPWSRPPGGGQPPDIEEWLRRGQDRVRRFVPGGVGGSLGFGLVLLVALAIWGLSGLYRVEPDEQGVVLRFGQWVRTESSGLRYHVPWPIEEVFTPKVTRINRIEVGYRSAGMAGRTPTTLRDVSDESMMLTSDENIIDIDFTVFWMIKDAGHYLFKIRDPENTVKKAAESAMREVIGRTDLQPALTEARMEIESATKALLQRMLDDYQSGIEVTQVQLQKSDPPGQVVDAFNDVQRARSDRERLRNEAEAYRNDIIPRARGEAVRLRQEAEAYREQVVSLAKGDASRFLAIYDAYSQSRSVAGRRMYLETIEEVLKDAHKIILDPAIGGGAVPYLPLPELLGRAEGARPAAGRGE